jgi:hypothetical protein
MMKNPLSCPEINNTGKRLALKPSPKGLLPDSGLKGLTFSREGDRRS